MVSMNGSGGGHLVLSHKEGDLSELWDERGNVIAEVKVVEIRGDKVRLSFLAPREIGIYRGKVADAIRREKAESGKVA